MVMTLFVVHQYKRISKIRGSKIYKRKKALRKRCFLASIADTSRRASIAPAQQRRRTSKIRGSKRIIFINPRFFSAGLFLYIRLYSFTV